MTVLEAAPGDVIAVWTSAGLAADLIRAGEALRGLPAIANHVAIITHQDRLGRWIGIQGQPGGVGLADCTPWLADPRTRSNHAQPKPGDHGQLPNLLASCVKSIGVGYDWAGIAEDAALALHASDLAALLDRLRLLQVKPLCVQAAAHRRSAACRKGSSEVTAAT